MSRWAIIDKSLEGRKSLYFPHHHLVPMDLEANLRFRRNAYMTTDRADRRRLWKMCSEDFLFYVKVFVNIFQAKGDPKPVPFVPYDFQEELFTLLWRHLHDRQGDVRIKKPRDVGASWAIMALFEHAWKFRSNVHLLIGSRREMELDGVMTDPNSDRPMGEWSKLLPKVDFIHLNQPAWMWPEGYRPRTEPYRTRLRLVNPANGSLIAGESASARFGRSGRYYAIGFDEHAHTDYGYDIIASCSQTSDCHIWWSSPNGPDCGFALLGRTPISQVNLSWWMVPGHAADMTIDPATEKRTSPWFEKECIRLGWDQKLINDEILADESRASGAYYGPDIFDLLEGVGDRHGSVMDPVHVGELDIEKQQIGPRVTRFCDQENGRWHFWRPFDADGTPPRNTRYVIGVDVAMGSQDSAGRGASNSVIAVADGRTGEIVAEFAVHGVPPYDLAEIAAAVGYWFEGEDGLPALMIPERNGPGAMFIDVLVQRLKYENMYLEQKNGKARYGWHKDGAGDSARLAFGLHQLMIVRGRLLERSHTCVQEMKHYEVSSSGRGAPAHRASLIARDPSGARDNHGDRVISRICICQGLEWLRDAPVKSVREPPRGSLAWLEQRNEERELAVGRV